MNCLEISPWNAVQSTWHQHEGICAGWGCLLINYICFCLFLNWIKFAYEWIKCRYHPFANIWVILPPPSPIFSTHSLPLEIPLPGTSRDRSEGNCAAGPAIWRTVLSVKRDRPQNQVNEVKEMGAPTPHPCFPNSLYSSSSKRIQYQSL